MPDVETNPLTPDERRRVDEQLRLAELARSWFPGQDAPYFAHMRLTLGGRTAEVLLGSAARTESAASVIDWRTAPLAEVFFSTSEGEEYELESAGRSMTGTLLESNRVAFQRGELVEIAHECGVLSRSPDGAWTRREPAAAPRSALRPPEVRGHPSSPADVRLDAAQRRVVELPRGRAALVLGEAGCGKTTVALHRLAHLRRAAGPTFRAAVIVPTEGLRRLSESMLRRLGVSDAEVWLYDAWAAHQARRVFQDLPAADGAATPAAAVRIKRHPAVREVLHELAALPPALPEEGRPVVETPALARREDLQALFGDRVCLERIAARSDGAINSGMIADVLEHTRVQFSETAEEEWSHVTDKQRLRTLDGRLMDEGTPMEDAGRVDAEDFAVLFELERLRARRRGAAESIPLRYDCVVVDEAQELAPLELALVGRSVAPGGTLVVAGDAEQQVDPDASFLGWEAAMAELGAADYERAVLDVSYRCPPEVTALAHALRAEGTGALPRSAGRVLAERLPSELHLVAWLIKELGALRELDPAASLAVVCRTERTAERMARLLRRGLGVRLALGGEFLFRAGANVSCVEEIKGLEFDYVFVPDASAETYPATAQARRALYVALTRPTHHLAMATVGPWTPLLGG